MGGHDGDMRAAARRDPDFRGIDPAELGRLIRNVQDASKAVTGWLAGHRPPPGVPATGYRQAAEAAHWADEQLGMLTRRHSYAVTHPDTGGGVSAPTTPPRTGAPEGGAPGGPPGGSPGTGVPLPVTPPARPRPGTPSGTRPTTPVGAGGDLGNFPTREAAAKAARADALAITRATEAGRPVPDQVWRQLTANADDPDYTAALYARLGPEGTADLLNGLPPDGPARAARLAVLSGSLGVAGHHIMVIDEGWVRALLARAELNGTRAVAVQMLTNADLGRRGREALAEIGPPGVTSAGDGGSGDGGGGGGGGGGDRDGDGDREAPCETAAAGKPGPHDLTQEDRDHGRTAATR